MPEFFNVSGGLQSDDDVPGLVDSPSEAEDEDMKNVSGQVAVYPWHKEPCAQSNFVEQAARWLKLSAEGLNNAFIAIERLLYSPFLFQKLVIPEKWIRWAARKDIILYDIKERKLPEGRLMREHYVVTRMFQTCLKKLKTIVNRENNVINIIKMMYSIRHITVANDDRAIKETKHNEHVKAVAEHVKVEAEKNFGVDAKFFKICDRDVFTVLLCFRQFAEVLYIIACEGRNISVEVKNIYTDKLYHLTDNPNHGREKGNDLYKKSKYNDAIEVYTEAINKSPFHYLLYSNRCQTYIKMDDYQSAFADAYRAVVLKPDWIKGYYKLVRCLDELTYYDEAIYWGKLGLEQCSDDTMRKSLKIQIETISSKIPKLSKSLEAKPTSSNKENKPVTKNAKKKRKRKKKAKTTEDEDVPELVSDEEFDGSAAAESSKKKAEEKMVKETAEKKKKEAEKIRKKEAEEKRKKEAEEKRKKEEEEMNEREAEENFRKIEEARKESKSKANRLLLERITGAEQEKKYEESFIKKLEEKNRKDEERERERLEKQRKRDEEKKKRDEEKKKRAEEQRKRAEELKKKDEEAKKEAKRKADEKRKMEEQRRKEIQEREQKEKVVRELQKDYERYVEKGSVYFFKDCFNDACKSYSLAIALFEKHEQIHGCTDSDFATLLYCRGIASQRQEVASEVHFSQTFFRKILTDIPSFSHICMVYFANAKSIYLLNNFEEAFQEASKALQSIKKSHINGLLSWPGTTENIPESNEKFLKQEIRILKQQCKLRPTPAAVCHYDGCSRDYQRKEIYVTDLNFEGYFVMSCEWNCVLKFHLRCWPKFKQQKFNLPGDKEILGVSCLTPDCQGRIILIKWLDEDLVEKKGLKFPTEKKVFETKMISSKYDHRTSKSESNLKKYKEILADKKAKRRKYESPQNMETTKTSRNNEAIPINIPADIDLSQATVYVKSSGSDNSQKVHGQGKSSRRISPVCFQQFCSTLPGYQRGMTLDQVTDAIERAKLNFSFTVPDDLRQEIANLELALSDDDDDDVVVTFTDDEKMKMPFLFEYFQDFFSVQGPLDTSDELFKSQLILLPMDMQNIVKTFGGLVEFLTSNPLFIQIPPYIGIHTQHNTLKQLTDTTPNLEHRTELSSRTSSIDHDIYNDFDGMSQFAKEFYQIGAHIVVDEDIEEGDMYKLDQFTPEPPKLKNSQNSETSSMFSFDALETMEDLKSESGSLASIDTDKSANAFRRPVTPLKQTVLQLATQNTSKSKKKKNAMLTSEMGTQTIGKDEGEKAKEAVARLQERLEEIENTCTKLKRTSQTQEESLLKQLEEAKEREKAAIQKHDSLKQATEAEMLKITQMKKQAQDKVNLAETKMAQIRASEQEAQQNLSSLTAGMQRDREHHLNQILDLRKSLELKEIEANANRVRAIKAEVGLMRAKEAYHVGSHMQARAQCEQVVRDFDLEITRLTSALPEHILQHFRLAKKHWAGNALACGKHIETLKSAYSSIIEQLGAGHKLADLQPVPDLKPPEPGPTPRQMLMQLQRNDGSFGFKSNGAMGSERINGGNSGTTVTNGNQGVNGTKQKQPQPHARNNAGPRNSPPVSAAQALVTPVAAGVAGTEARPVRKNNFEKLVDKLSNNIPQLTREQVERCAQHVRAQNKGLTGLLYEEIEQRIKAMSGVNGKTSQGTLKKYLVKSDQMVSGQNEMLEYEDEDTTCPICCDPLKDGKISILECQHKFHFACINKWMQKQRTCPNCRKFMADSSEFPALTSQNGVAAPPGLPLSRDSY